MTDLSVAYGFDESNSPMFAMQSPPPPVSKFSAPPPPPVMQSQQDSTPVGRREPPVNINRTGDEGKADAGYYPPNSMYAKQGPGYGGGLPDSFWDRLGSRRWEVLKVFSLALIIVLGISLEKIIAHYVGEYIEKSFLSVTTEFLLRISVPVAVIITIWIIKAA